MEDHKLGKHCQITECRQIDWMPMGCKYCKGTFCYDHYSIENHKCKEIDKTFKKVMQCPFCLSMIRMNANLSPEQSLSIHELTECMKKQAPKKATCSRDKCPVIITEINKFVCSKCDQTLCTKHRFPSDHTCASAIKRRWLNFGQA